MNPPGKDELEAVAPFVGAIITLLQWVGGFAAAAWIIGRFMVRTGEEKRRYEELVEDVAAVKEHQAKCITIPQHDDMQRICTSNLERIIDAKLHHAVMDMRSEMSTMNGNICKIMGALNIDPIEGMGQRRRSDRGEQ